MFVSKDQKINLSDICDICDICDIYDLRDKSAILHRYSFPTMTSRFFVTSQTGISPSMTRMRRILRPKAIYIECIL
jgi:hypothetical protein